MSTPGLNPNPKTQRLQGRRGLRGQEGREHVELVVHRDLGDRTALRRLARTRDHVLDVHPVRPLHGGGDGVDDRDQEGGVVLPLAHVVDP